MIPIPTETVISQDYSYSDLVALWVLRLLTHTSAHKKFLKNPGLSDVITEILGHAIGDEPKKPTEWMQNLRSRLCEQEQKSILCEGSLFDNIKLLADSLGLTPIEQDILAFRTLCSTEPALIELMDGFRFLSDLALARLLSIALNQNVNSLRKILCEKSVLFSSGLIKLHPSLMRFDSKLDLLNGYANNFVKKAETLDDLISLYVSKARQPTLKLGDYSYIHDQIYFLIHYLKQARQTNRSGVNILIHGIPGTGKTELAQLMAQELGMTLYEVVISVCDGTAIEASARFDTYVFSQKLFKHRVDTLILFDEIEDVMPNRYRTLDDSKRESGVNKAWTNRLLEENPVPTFWVANAVHHIDPAFLRRFDYILEMHIPPRAVRRRILEKYLDDLPVNKKWVERQSEDARLSPALTERAVKVIRLAGLSKAEDIEKHFQRIVLNNLQAQGEDVDSARYPEIANYNLDFINTSIDIKSLPATLARCGKGRILLHGAPGTGKTAFVHHLAKTLDKPLTVKRASDILSMWLGGTEKNIKKMFKEAVVDESVLFLDEADSFLQDRRAAQRSWEITQVNEMLTQMEVFQGIFICSTNFMENLDIASLRRFGLKIHFDYLKSEQSWKLFLSTLEELGGEILDELSPTQIQRELANLANLTPGDFTAITQQWAMLDKPVSPSNLLETVQQESRLKLDGPKRSIGFTS